MKMCYWKSHRYSVDGAIYNLRNHSLITQTQTLTLNPTLNLTLTHKPKPTPKPNPNHNPKPNPNGVFAIRQSFKHPF